MSHRILNVPPDCDELKEFIELFKFQSEKETYDLAPEKRTS